MQLQQLGAHSHPDTAPDADDAGSVEAGARHAGDGSMLQLADTLGAWRGFYALLGEASATMVGLLFVAASVGSGAFSGDRRAALRVFLSASVVNFSLILASCLIVLAPVHDWISLGVMILAGGLFGLTHAGLALRDTLRDGLIAAIDLEDRARYLVLPLVGYLLVALSGVALALQLDMGCLALAISTGMLLTVGVHNAWDITVWGMTRRRQ